MKLFCGVAKAISSFDEDFCAAVNRSMKSRGFFEYIMAIFAVTFNNEQPSFFWACVLLFLPFNINSAIAVAALPGLCLFITLLFKKMISRPRPVAYPPRSEILRYNLRGSEKTHSMPSGDSAQAALFWSFLYVKFGFPGWLCLILTLATMFSRIYYMCHFPSDTIMGALLGLSVTVTYTNLLMP
ncbi:unnamed protein product [Blepharisma stoltei]|uniref:Phosphatidic acid phosphatase type 2/haloperoxidase domain-containing protein n=1 Tax=Blepharisma stoltei TaxID=1481888 RepID=A0AAU9JLE4_9CILI|nr:unnamed protein product [Blepharisma stoltei]